VLRSPAARTVTHYLSRGVRDAPYPPHPPPPAPPPYPVDPTHPEYWHADLGAPGRAAREKLDRRARAALARSSPHEKFLHWLRTQPDNCMVRLLCGFDCKHVLRGQLARHHLEIAKSKLDRFSMVAIVERLEDTIEGMRKTFHWSNVTEVEDSRPSNEESKFLERMQVDKDVEKEMFGMHLWDNALYLHVNSLMEAEKAEAHQHMYSIANEHCEHRCCEYECAASVYMDTDLVSANDTTTVYDARGAPILVDDSMGRPHGAKERLRSAIKERETGAQGRDVAQRAFSEKMKRMNKHARVGAADRRGIVDPELRRAQAIEEREQRLRESEKHSKEARIQHHDGSVHYQMEHG